MPAYQVSQYWEFQRWGWQEVFYCDAANADAANNLADVNIDRLLAFRAPGVTLKAIRAVEVYNPRVGALKPYNKVARTYNAADFGFPANPDVVQSAVFCRLSQVAGPSRPIFLRGLPDFKVLRQANGAPDFAQISQNLQDALKAYKSTPPYTIRSTRPASDPTAAKFKIQSVTRVSAAVTRIGLTGDDWNQLEGNKNMVWYGNTQSRVLIQGGLRDAHDLPNLRGVFTVLNWGDLNRAAIDVTYRMPQNITTAWQPATLTVRNLWYEFGAIEKLVPYDFRSRDTGRPSSLSRGRSRKANTRT